MARRKKYSIRRVRLNRGGYTSFGRYFGVGQPLYEFEVDEDVIVDSPRSPVRLGTGHFRAGDRKAALAELRKLYPELAKKRKRRTATQRSQDELIDAERRRLTWYENELVRKGR